MKNSRLVSKHIEGNFNFARGTAAVALLSVSACSGGAEWQSSGEASAEQVADSVNRATLQISQRSAPLNLTRRVPFSRRADRMQASNEALFVSLPSFNRGRVQLGADPSAALVVALPDAEVEREAEVTGDGTVVFTAGIAATDVAVQASEEGVRIHTVSNSVESPVEFAYEVELPSGGKLDLLENGGVAVLDAQGGLRGGFAPPWALDRANHSVPTHYEVRGASVVQVVQHRDGAVQYPVVADPWLWKDLISSASWASSSQGWTLKVIPTTWARLNAGGYAVGVAGWDELYSKYKNRGLNTNLDGMRDQFICHQQIVAIRSPNKPSWNLAEWRPNVSYLATVNAQCNPGGSSIFD